MILLLVLLAQAKPVALTGGDVHTVTQGVHKGGTVLVKDGKIARVGTGFELPEGTVRIDVTGKRVLPGFIAARATGLGAGGGQGKIADALDPFHESIKVALAGGLTSAFVEGGSSDGFFGGGGGNAPPSDAVVKMTYGTLDGMVLLEPASVSLAAWVRGSPSERHELREGLRRARAHLEDERAFERRRSEGKLAAGEAPPKPSPAAERWLKLLRGEVVARIPAGDAEKIQKALELLEEFRIRAVLTGVYEGWTLPDAIGRSRASCVFSVRGVKVHPERGATRPSGSSIEQAAILRKAGVRFAIVPPGLDAGTGGIPGRDLGYLPMEAAFAIRGGLDEATALEAITIRAAEACGVETRIGSIEEGKDADLVVTDGDPFDYRTLVELTMVNGRVYYERSKSPAFSHLKEPSPK
ncbi:MAG TPA: amidohydrolase family protein [Planctomycetota bacterium]